MTLTEFVSDYGYAAVLVGTLLEGESILLLAGFAAHQGYLAIELVLLIAFFGGTVGDQVFFWIGRRWGEPLLERFPALKARTTLVGTLLRRWDAALVFAIRFMYGLRIAGPVAMGALGVSRGRFAVFNALGAAVWALLIGGAGYLLGQSLEVLLGDIQEYEGLLLAIVVVAFALVLIAGRVRRALKRRAAVRALAAQQARQPEQVRLD
ncbi:MAG: DedA family protein [Burkholderiales bacterium]|nr:DedA family protein [Burkholderiales bacterium]